jgi:hypothetical protein
VLLTIYSAVGTRFDLLAAVDADLFVDSRLEIERGEIAGSLRVTNPETHLLVDQRDIRPQPADIQAFSRAAAPFRAHLDGTVLTTDLWIVHFRERTHTVLSFEPGIERDVRRNAERGLARLRLAPSLSGDGPDRHEPATVEFHGIPMGLPDCDERLDDTCAAVAL